MASVYCSVCAQFVVRHSGDVCATCRAKGHVSIRDTKMSQDADKLMGPLEPRILVETAMRQTRIMQARLQQVIDGAGDTGRAVYRGDVVNELSKISRTLQTLVGEWRALSKDAREAAEQMDVSERIQVLTEWFGGLSKTEQRDLIQALTRAHNEGAA